MTIGFNITATLLNEEELALLEGVDRYRDEIFDRCQEMLEKTKNECQIMLEQTKEKCQQLETDKIEELKQLLIDQSQQLKQENYDLIASFLNHVENSLFETCYKISNKLSLNVSGNQLINLVKEELLNYTKEPELKISANSYDLEQLQENLADEQNLHIKYICNDKLGNNQIVIGSSLVTIHTDLNRCKDELLTLLQQFTPIPH